MLTKNIILVGSSLLLVSHAMARKPHRGVDQKARDAAAVAQATATKNASAIKALQELVPRPGPDVGTDLTEKEGGVVACTKSSGGIANLIVSADDYYGVIEWSKKIFTETETGSGGTTPPFANSYTDGRNNTDSIVFQNGAGTSYAAGICDALVEGGKSDWYLPSLGELNCLFENQGAINKSIKKSAWFRNVQYWSSTESARDGATKAYSIDFTGGLKANQLKRWPLSVRCVRAFTP